MKKNTPINQNALKIVNIQNVENLHYSLPREIPRYLTNVPHVNIDGIYGREKDISTVHKLLISAEKKILIQGIGGIGKTTFKKAYIAKHSKYYDHIIWLENSYNLTKLNFVRNNFLVKSLELPFQEEDVNEKFENIMYAISLLIDKKCILILDDVYLDIIKKEILSKLPSPPDWTILLSTRTNFKHPDFEIYTLTELSFKDAQLIFETYYTNQYNKGSFDRLLSNIKRHPLTIELLAKTLENNYIIEDVDSFLELFSEHQLSDIEWQFLRASSENDKEMEVSSHLLKTFDIVGLNDIEKEILTFFSVIPEVEISGFTLLKLLAQKSNERKKYNNGLISLYTKGWLQKNNNNFKIHALIAIVMRLRLSPDINNLATPLTLLNEIIQNSFQDYEVNNTYYPIIKKMVHYLESSIETNIPELLIILSKMEQHYGNYKETIRLSEKVISISKKNKNIDLEWQVLANLAVIYKKNGEYDKAANCFDKAFQIVKRENIVNLNLLSLYANKASFLHQLGNIDEAKGILIDILSEIEGLTIDTPNQELAVAEINLMLAKILLTTMELEESIKLHEKHIPTIEKFYGNNHMATLISYSNLSRAYKDCGKKELALKYMTMAISIAEKSYPNHPELETMQEGLASIYFEIGEFEKASSILKDIIYNGNLPKKHPRVARIKDALGTSYYYLERFQDALKELHEAEMLDLYNYSANDHRIGLVYFHLGLVYNKLKSFDKAAKYALQALTVSIENFGENHEQTRWANALFRLVMENSSK